ncbi:MAG TPA: sugar-binding transcriptional regulator [Longilinea sp.]|nr:sugar-binding transcriptional regulator [Longilinea sp.]
MARIYPEVDLMVQAARLYYDNDLTQEQIAQHLQITRQKVSRLIAEAKNIGIVHITISDPSPNDPKLAEGLKEKFGLKNVILTTSEGIDPEQIRSRIGMAAAEYIIGVLRDGAHVGIGWGRTLFYAVNSVPKGKQAQINVVPLIGGIGDMTPFFQVNELARRLAEAFGGSYRFIYAPAFTPDQSTYKGLIKSQEINSIQEQWNLLEFAVVGIGQVEFQKISSMFFAEHITPNTLSQLETQGAVGDICGRFYDITGKSVKLSEGVIGISLEKLLEIPDVIGIAGGVEKVPAILGALRGGFIKTLVTDTTTAKAIMELS